MSANQRDYRSDERLHDLICGRLDDDYDVDATLIEVSVADGEVTLLGHVPKSRMRDRAETLALGVPGVRDVHDELMIDDEHVPPRPV